MDRASRAARLEDIALVGRRGVLVRGYRVLVVPDHDCDKGRTRKGSVAQPMGLRGRRGMQLSYIVCARELTPTKDVKDLQQLKEHRGAVPRYVDPR